MTLIEALGRGGVVKTAIFLLENGFIFLQVGAIDYIVL